MKKTLKALMTLGLASVMLFTTAITSFAEDVPENVITFFGQTPVQTGYRETTTGDQIFSRTYEVIIYGRDILNADDVKIIADGWAPLIESGGTLELVDYTEYGGDWHYLFREINGEMNWDLNVMICLSYIPEGTPIESLGADAQYVIYPDGSTVNPADIPVNGAWNVAYSSTSEVQSGQSDPKETVTVGGEPIDVWEFNVNDKMVMTVADNVPSGVKVYLERYSCKDDNGTYRWVSMLPSKYLLGETSLGQEIDLYKALETYSASNENITNMNDVVWGIGVANGNQNSDGLFWVKLVGDKTQDTGDWASNETGWWIQFKDGSYLTNSWWQSPYSGLWYYMGADGYMVTNTTIDGYTINADGVWVQ